VSYTPDWEKDGADWPNRAASRFVSAGGTRWHVQEAGEGPTILLVHGTGAATHSWRGVLPLLAVDHRVIAVDLPGHGFTRTMPGGRLTIGAMAGALSALLSELDVKPDAAVGHSAGAVVLAQMALDGRIAPGVIVSFNGAFMPIGGFAGQLFSPIAKLMVLNPFAPSLMSRHFRDAATLRKLLADTGSRIDEGGLKHYATLARAPAHIAGALDMMANWDLPGFIRELPRLKTPLVLVAASNDKTIPPGDSDRVKGLLPSARIIRLPRLGHLAHEEDPKLAAELIAQALAAHS
jgi:magnesium chelatase accessory protein